MLAILNDTELFQNIYDIEKTSKDYQQKVSDANIMLFSKIYDLLFNQKFEDCDIFLQKIELKRLVPEIKLGLFKMIFTAKDSLSCWETFSTNIQNMLEKDGYKTEVFLKGMLT